VSDPSAPTLPDDRATIPRWTRGFAYGLISLVLLAGLASVEVWPLSGFKLFSATRGPTSVSWELRPVIDQREGERLSFADEGAGFGYSVLALDDFDEMSAAERDEICAAWVRPLREDGVAVDELRVYRVTKDIRPDRAEAPSMRLMWTCART
jgi:hypothetical protein